MEASDALRSRIIFAREEIRDVTLSRDQLVYLCEAAGGAEAAAAGILLRPALSPGPR